MYTTYTHMSWLQAVHFSFTFIAIDSEAETEIASKLSGQYAARDWRLISRHSCGVYQPHRQYKQSRSHHDLGVNIIRRCLAIPVMIHWVQ